jgi:hypothetical protein
MLNWKAIRPLGLAAAALSLSACGTSYDCSNTDVVDALIGEAANPGQIAGMQEVPAEWQQRLASNTSAKNLVTLDKNDETQHYRCRANLEYRDDTRTVLSKDITYEVRKIEGEDDFTLEWEIENNGFANIDPIKMFSFDVLGQWRAEYNAQREKESLEQLDQSKRDAREWARGFAVEYAAKNPPKPFGRDALKKHADDALAYQDVERIMDQFHDIDGDGFQDYFAIVAKREFHEGQFAEETENYGQYTNTGGFMRKDYFFVAVTQTFKGFGLETNVGLHDGKITSVDGEKVTERYLPKEIANVAKEPPNPIVGVTNAEGNILVRLADGQVVTIEDFKSEKTLPQLQQERMRNLEDQLAELRATGRDESQLYQ